MKYKISINANFGLTLMLGFEGSREEAEEFAETFAAEYTPRIVLNPTPERLLNMEGAMDLEVFSVEKCSSIEPDPELEARYHTLELANKLNERSSEVSQRFSGPETLELAKLIVDVGSNVVGELASMVDTLRDQSPENQTGLIIAALRQIVSDNGADWISRFDSKSAIMRKGSSLAG